MKKSKERRKLIKLQNSLQRNMSPAAAKQRARAQLNYR